jgi:hypothetical protein
MADLTKATKELTSQTQAWPDRARAVVVDTREQYESAAEMLLGIKSLRQQVEQMIGPVVRDAHAAHKSALALKKMADAPLDEAEQVLKKAMVAFRRAQEQRDKEERQSLEAEAKKMAKAQGVEMPAVMIASSLPTVAGVTASATWTVEVTDAPALITAAVRNTALRPLLKVDMPALRHYVRAMKGQVKIPGVQVQASETLAVRPGASCAEVRS